MDIGIGIREIFCGSRLVCKQRRIKRGSNRLNICVELCVAYNYHMFQVQCCPVNFPLFCQRDRINEATGTVQAASIVQAVGSIGDW